MRFFAVMFAFPFGFFAVLSLVKQIGLHWMLGFVPFFFVVAGWMLSREQLRRSVVYLAAFSALHVAAIAVAAALPLETWKKSRAYDGIVYHVRINDILRRAQALRGGIRVRSRRLLARGHRLLLFREVLPVFGHGSSYARHDDIVTDFRPLDGRNILVLRKNPPENSEYRPYFRSVEYKQFTLSGATFYIVLGRGFDFAAYREGVLKPVRERFYAIPRYLPQGRCYFCERYLGAATCPG